MRKLTMAALMAAAAGCATVTPYQPLSDGLGYSEQKLESNRYRVSFTASAKTPAPRVTDYLLYRAAELTLQNGHDYFLLVGQAQGRRQSAGGVSVGVGGHGGSGGGGIGIGIGIGTGLGGSQPWQASADVLMYSGSKPSADAAAYDARAIKESLGPAIDATRR